MLDAHEYIQKQNAKTKQKNPTSYACVSKITWQDVTYSKLVVIGYRYISICIYIYVNNISNYGAIALLSVCGVIYCRLINFHSNVSSQQRQGGTILKTSQDNTASLWFLGIAFLLTFFLPTLNIRTEGKKWKKTKQNKARFSGDFSWICRMSKCIEQQS